jgi:hypothetical protein
VKKGTTGALLIWAICRVAVLVAAGSPKKGISAMLLPVYAWSGAYMTGRFSLSKRSIPRTLSLDTRMS